MFVFSRQYKRGWSSRNTFVCVLQRSGFPFPVLLQGNFRKVAGKSVKTGLFRILLDSGRLVEDKGILMENPFRLKRSGLPIEDIVELLPVFVQQRGGPFLVKADALEGGVGTSLHFVISSDRRERRNLREPPGRFLDCVLRTALEMTTCKIL